MQDRAGAGGEKLVLGNEKKDDEIGGQNNSKIRLKLEEQNPNKALTCNAVFDGKIGGNLEQF